MALGPSDSESLDAAVDAIAVDVGLSGVVRVDVAGERVVQRAYGPADRAHRIPNAIDTQFAIASGSKSFTALTVVSLVESGELGLDMPVRSLLGDDLPLIDDRVTVEQLLAHRSGIGDYFDEEAVTDPTDHVLTVPVHELATTEQFLGVLSGHPMLFEPGAHFRYSNGGYVVLALIAERATGTPFHQLVSQRVCAPAGMIDTAYLRSDELPGRAAVGYLADDGLRTNVFHLPVRGNGDGGAYSTAADVHALWDALSSGRIVSASSRVEMLRARSAVPEEPLHHGLGFWVDPVGGTVSMHGFDAGVGFVSVRDADGRFTYTVLGNKGRGAWPVSVRLAELVTAAG